MPSYILAKFGNYQSHIAADEPETAHPLIRIIGLVITTAIGARFKRWIGRNANDVPSIVYRGAGPLHCRSNLVETYPLFLQKDELLFVFGGPRFPFVCHACLDCAGTFLDFWALKFRLLPSFGEP